MTFRSRKLLDADAGKPCVRCGCEDGTIVPAHYTGVRRNAFGGGLGIKVADILTARLCRKCHEWIDTLSRDKEDRWEHSEEFLTLIALTIVKRLEEGILVIA